MLDPDEVDKSGMPLTARCVSCSSQHTWFFKLTHKYFYFSMFLMNVIRLSFYEPLLLLTICIEFYNNLSIKLFFLQSRVAILLINLLFEHLDKKTENLYSLERL